MTDEETLKHLAGDKAMQTAALRRLYEGKGREFGRFFVGRGLDRAEADDVVQETMLKILKQAPGFAWMWQIARNALIDHQRRYQHEVNLDDAQWKKAEDDDSRRPPEERVFQSTDAHDPSREAEDCVSKGLSRFAADEPERAYAIELVVEGIDGREIADRIGRTYTATRQYLLQCRQRLAPYIKDCLPLLTA
jgi:RNA polymerase sigma factor (sigma-70 family)